MELGVAALLWFSSSYILRHICYIFIDDKDVLDSFVLRIYMNMFVLMVATQNTHIRSIVRSQSQLMVGWWLRLIKLCSPTEIDFHKFVTRSPYYHIYTYIICGLNDVAHLIERVVCVCVQA